MHTLLIYDSKRGGTQQVVTAISQQLTHVTTVQSIENFSAEQLSDYDQVLFAAPTYAGSLRKAAATFLEDNHSLLTEKRLFLVNTGIQFDQDKISSQLEAVFPEELRKTAHATVFVGGISLISKMNLFEKLILKKVFSDNQIPFEPKTDYKRLDMTTLNQLIYQMNQKN